LKVILCVSNIYTWEQKVKFKYVPGDPKYILLKENIGGGQGFPLAVMSIFETISLCFVIPKIIHEGKSLYTEIREGREHHLTTNQGVLLSRTTTTSWMNWIHGELWLFPNGIMRSPFGWRITLSTSTYLYQYQSDSHRVLEQDSLAFWHVRSLPQTPWLPREILTQAHLNHSFGADELELTTILLFIGFFFLLLALLSSFLRMNHGKQSHQEENFIFK
jgi:hypothetical protein